MADNTKWSTSITTHDDNGDPIIRGYNLLDLIQKVNFTQSIFLVLRGELPNEKEEQLFNAILVSTIDHGVGAPSTTVARITASSGVPSSTAIANGIATIGENHGGAAEAAAKMLQENVDRPAGAIVADYKNSGRRLPGYGHKIYEVDPRTQTLLKIAEETGFNGKFVQKALEIEKQLNETSSKKLPLNIDGISAALMCELGFNANLGKSLFIISRVAGIAAHVAEEQELKTLRRLDEDEIGYTGVSPRKLP